MSFDFAPYAIIGFLVLCSLIQCIGDRIKYMKYESAKATIKNIVCEKDSDHNDYYLLDVDYCTEYGKYGSSTLTVYSRYKIGETLDARYDKEKDELLIERSNFKFNIIISFVVMIICIVKIIGVLKE